MIYSSEASGASAREFAPAILRQSRLHNGIDGVTGLLCAQGDRFLQVLEGAGDSVEQTMERILADPRHHRIEVLADRAVERREFGDWAMAYRDRGQPEAVFGERLRVLLAEVSDEVADRFRGFAEA